MMKFPRKYWINLIGVVAIIAATTTFVCLNMISAWAFILAAIACYPMAKRVFFFSLNHHMCPVRRLQHLLPKIGAEIEKAEWKDNGMTKCFYVNYKEELFLIHASLDYFKVTVYDLEWLYLKPSLLKSKEVHEAIMEVNWRWPNVSIALNYPDEDGGRSLGTASQSILPIFGAKEFLADWLTQMLNYKFEFMNALAKERPYLASKSRTTVGFHMDDTEQNPEEQEVPAAPAANKNTAAR